MRTIVQEANYASLRNILLFTMPTFLETLNRDKTDGPVFEAYVEHIHEKQPENSPQRESFAQITVRIAEELRSGTVITLEVNDVGRVTKVR